MATPEVLNITIQFVAHELRRPRYGCWRGRSSAIGGPRTTRRRQSSILGHGGAPTSIAAAEDACGLATCIRMVWTILISSTTDICHVARPCGHGRSGFGRADRCDRLLLRSHGDEETAALTARPDSHNYFPLPGVPKMSGKRTPMGSQESLLRSVGRVVARRAGLAVSTGGFYPGSGHKDA